jgi:hypothetical protein
VYPIGGDYAANEDRDLTLSKQGVIEGPDVLAPCPRRDSRPFFIVGFGKSRVTKRDGWPGLADFVGLRYGIDFAQNDR